MQEQPRPRQSRGPTVPIVNREVEDEENSSEREEDDKAGEEQQSIMAKGRKKSKKASKAKKEVRKGLTRLNANGELEWLATASSEGGKVSSILSIYVDLTNHSSSGDA